MDSGQLRKSPRNLSWGPTATWLLAFALAALFIAIAGRGSQDRFKLTVGLCLGSFAVGSVAGFLFTSYGEETATIGKIRDWLIGGITGLTIAKAQSIKALWVTFAAGPGPQEFSLVVGESVTFLVLGFFFMFFQREIVLNVLLAESRAQRGRLDGTLQAGIVTLKALTALPPNLLSGIEDIDELVEENKPQAEEIRTLLLSDDVSNFLGGAEKAAASGMPLDWDIVSKAAHLHYYRTYFAKGDEREGQEDLAIQWILRALFMNPHHVDLTAKYADVLGMQKRYADAVKMLEELNSSTDAPAYIQQWLGYFFLFVDREEEAIEMSESFHSRFPDEDSGLFNAACGYAQLYEKELIQKGLAEDKSSENRRRALERLNEALKILPTFSETVRTKWTEPDESFFVFRQDSDFQKLVGYSPASQP